MLLAAQKVYHILVVYLEVADADLRYHFVSPYLTEYLPDCQRNQTMVALHTLHCVGLAGRGLTVRQDAC